MSKFYVSVRRVEYREHVFEMEADTSEAAVSLVEQEELPDYDWRNSPVYHGDEEVVAVVLDTSKSEG